LFHFNFNFNLKNMFGLTGTISEKQADKTSNKLANACLLLVAGGLVVALIAVIRWW